MITKRTIDEVFDQAKIEEVAGDFVNLTRRGSNLLGLCPFHDEKTPSFSVSPTKNIYKCFGCGRGGSVVHFVMEHERYSYPEAIRYLARKYNIPVEETQSSNEEKLAMQEAESLRLVNQFAHTFFVRSLHETQEGKAVGLTYFKERGYLEDTIKTFELGYAPEQSEALKQAALAQGFSEERLKTLGLINQGGRDMYRGRVVFPIHNLSGTVIAFGARTLKGGPKEPKYINSPESPVYAKRRVLFGMHLAKAAIRKTDMCYLVEGYTDVISLVQAGIENVVSSSGTALTVEQARLIRRFTHNITVLYDGDPAGVKAALRGLDLLLEEDMHVRLVLLPEKDDPDSLVNRLGQQGFLDFLARETRDFILFKTALLNTESRADPVKRSIMVRDIVQSIALIPDPIRRSTYLQECSQLMGIEERILVLETSKAIRARVKRKQSERRPAETLTDPAESEMLDTRLATPPVEAKSVDEYQERNIIRLLIQSGSETITIDGETSTVAEYVIHNIADVVDAFDNPLYAKIWGMFRDAVEGEQHLSSETLKNHPDSGIARLAIEFLSTPYEYSENWEKKKNLPLLSQRPPEENHGPDSVESVLRFKECKIQNKIKENKALIEQYHREGNDAQRLTHLKIHDRLMRVKHELGERINSMGIRL